MVKCLVYNLQLAAPAVMLNGQMDRIGPIADKVLALDPDVIVFLECFYIDAKDHLVDLLSDRYKEHRYLPRHKLRFLSGGVLILSKYPVISSQTLVYRNRSLVDGMASKGGLAVQVRHPEEGPLWIVGSHVQAWASHQTIRIKQFEELSEWLKIHVPQGSKVVILGDFNMDYHTKLKDLMKAARAIQVSKLTGSEQYTNNKKNHLRGLDGSAQSCERSYYCGICWSTDDPGVCRMKCDDMKDAKPVCECCENLMLDYGIILKGYRKAKEFTVQVLPWQADKPLTFQCWRIGWVSNPRLTTKDLSDHYPSLVTVKW